MKLNGFPPNLCLATATVFALIQHAQAAPIDDLAYFLRLADIVPAPPAITPRPLFEANERLCDNPCGAAAQLCCGADETCITNANGAASCANGAQKVLQKKTPKIVPRQNGQVWQTFTSTWVETNLVTRTSVYSVMVPAATSTVACNYAANESQCGSPWGSICCKSGYYCTNELVCAVAGNGGFTTVGVVGTVPARPTTISGVVVTSTVRASTTVAYQTPAVTGGTMNGNGTVEASTAGGGLSGGAIAGIVIGVLLGIGLLFLLCFCCCLQTILGCFGKGKKKKDRRHTTVISEDEYIRHHRHGGGGAAAALGLGTAALAGRQWHGRNSRRSSSDRYTRDSRRRPPPKKSKWGNGLTALASGAGAAALLGMFNKKKKGRSEKTGTSSSSSSRGSYSYYSYTDSSSADSRSRRTGPSRRGGGRRYDSRSRSRYTRSDRSRSRR